MTGKIYKSAQGKPIDLGALILENENVRAVGNMGVNARGDTINSGNQVIDSKNHRIQRQYKKQVANTSDLVPSSMTNAPVTVKKKKSTAVENYQTTDNQDSTSVNASVVEEEIINESITVVDEPPAVEVQQVSQAIPRGGLAAAIARSQSVKQELLKTPRQLAQEQAGVKKI